MQYVRPGRAPQQRVLLFMYIIGALFCDFMLRWKINGFRIRRNSLLLYGFSNGNPITGPINLYTEGTVGQNAAPASDRVHRRGPRLGLMVVTGGGGRLVRVAYSGILAPLGVCTKGYSCNTFSCSHDFIFSSRFSIFFFHFIFIYYRHTFSSVHIYTRTYTHTHRHMKKCSIKPTGGSIPAVIPRYCVRVQCV